LAGNFHAPVVGFIGRLRFNALTANRALGAGLQD
jgi:hypothetical protein